MTAETLIEKIHWPTKFDNVFFPFKTTTQHTILLQHYRRPINHE